MDDAVFRKGLEKLLRGGQAFAPAKRILADMKPELRAERPAAELHTVWELLEHLRIAQEDILRYTLDPSWQSPEFPAGYWPASADRVSNEQWTASVASFLGGLEEACALARDASRDLTSAIPHGEGRTYLRQILLIADHNAYHLGQIVDARKALRDWAD